MVFFPLNILLQKFTEHKDLPSLQLVSWKRKLSLTTAAIVCRVSSQIARIVVGMKIWFLNHIIGGHNLGMWVTKTFALVFVLTRQSNVAPWNGHRMVPYPKDVKIFLKKKTCLGNWKWQTSNCRSICNLQLFTLRIGFNSVNFINPFSSFIITAPQNTISVHLTDVNVVFQYQVWLGFMRGLLIIGGSPYETGSWGVTNVDFRGWHDADMWNGFRWIWPENTGIDRYIESKLFDTQQILELWVK